MCIRDRTGIIPEEKAIQLMKEAAQKTYGRKGEDVVKKNWAAIDAGANGVVKVEVPESWKNCGDEGLDYKTCLLYTSRCV